MMEAPKRIWLDWPEANKGDLVFDEPPEHYMQAGQTLYILANPEALAASPEGKKLVADAVAAERALWVRAIEAYFDAIADAAAQAEADAAAQAEADAAAIRRAAEGEKT